ncbi:hypothetical protein [Alkalicoccus chagannorensis]|uniref:hypothetical protein n=1 Tax=Alkalicoccus chagannorensis TaxID=427072 RepID=UPI000405EE10|nr:hypothetical protein [Alkalicoccus chagannorensis]
MRRSEGGFILLSVMLLVFCLSAWLLYLMTDHQHRVELQQHDQEHYVERQLLWAGAASAIKNRETGFSSEYEGRPIYADSALETDGLWRIQLEMDGPLYTLTASFLYNEETERITEWHEDKKGG